MGSTPRPGTLTSRVATRERGSSPRARSPRRATPRARRAAAAPREELLVVVNGNASGTEDAETLLARVTRSIAGAGSRATGIVTRSEAELARAVQRADGRRVALVGGDGSVHAAVNLRLPLPELAIIPAGRANNVARALAIPAGLGAASRIAARAVARPVDVLRVVAGGVSLFCVEGVSAGLQAAARQSYTAESSADLREGGRALLDATRRYRPYRFDVRAGGGCVFAGEAAQVFLSNLPLFGFGFRVNPLAQPSDGRFEVVVVRAATRRAVIARMPAVYRGRHVGREWALIRRVSEARLEGPVPLVGDSRPLGTGGAAVTVVRDRLRLAAP